jgi:uncharacterized protein with GYD domain
VRRSERRRLARERKRGKHGAEIKQLFMTMGAHDLVLVVEATGDEAVAKVALVLGAAGNIRTTTMKAFSEAEYRELTRASGASRSSVRGQRQHLALVAGERASPLVPAVVEHAVRDCPLGTDQLSARRAILSNKSSVGSAQHPLPGSAGTQE